MRDKFKRCKEALNRKKECQCQLLKIWTQCYKNKLSQERNYKMTWEKWGTMNQDLFMKFRNIRVANPVIWTKLKSIRKSSTLRESHLNLHMCKWEKNSKKRQWDWMKLKKTLEVLNKFKVNMSKDTSTKEIPSKKWHHSLKILNNIFLSYRQS